MKDDAYHFLCGNFGRLSGQRRDDSRNSLAVVERQHDDDDEGEGLRRENGPHNNVSWKSFSPLSARRFTGRRLEGLEPSQSTDDEKTMQK